MITTDISSQTVSIYASITLTVKISMEIMASDLQVQWTKDGQKISENSSRIHITMLSKSVFELVINSAEPSDAGHYTVQITSISLHISLQSSATVTVTGQGTFCGKKNASK